MSETLQLVVGWLGSGIVGFLSAHALTRSRIDVADTKLAALQGELDRRHAADQRELELRLAHLQRERQDAQKHLDARFRDVQARIAELDRRQVAQLQLTTAIARQLGVPAAAGDS